MFHKVLAAHAFAGLEVIAPATVWSLFVWRPVVAKDFAAGGECVARTRVFMLLSLVSMWKGDVPQYEPKERLTGY
jgi:hypothetical protein